MSRKLTALIVGVVASLALLAGTMQGCGSSSGNNNAGPVQSGLRQGSRLFAGRGHDRRAGESGM